MPEEQMRAWTILVDGEPFSTAFGYSPADAVARYAQGSIYDAGRLSAVAGVRWGTRGMPLPLSSAEAKRAGLVSTSTPGGGG